MNADWLLTESDSMSGESWRLSSLRCAEPCSLRELMNVKVLVTESRLALCNTTDCSTPNGHRFGWTLGVGDGQGGLACCDSWCYKESAAVVISSDLLSEIV